MEKLKRYFIFEMYLSEDKTVYLARKVCVYHKSGLNFFGRIPAIKDNLTNYAVKTLNKFKDDIPLTLIASINRVVFDEVRKETYDRLPYRELIYTLN